MEERIRKEIQAQLQDSPLLHLDRAEALVQLLRPAAQELIPALLEGRTGVLEPKQAQETQARRSLSMAADMDRPALERLLETLTEQEERELALQGCRGICLVPGRLLGPGGVSAPAAFLPVELRRGPEGWQMSACGEGLRPNYPLLSLLDPDCRSESWATGWERLQEQVEAAVQSRQDWNRTHGLWLTRMPLWLLDATAGEVPELPEAVPEPKLAWWDDTGEEGILAPLALDGRQMTALRRLRCGGSMLLRGSRGTGKTQLTAALMANAMGERQRVLYLAPALCDRQSLLERMDWMGLQELCLDLSPAGDRTAAVLRQFNRCVQLRPATTSEDYFPLYSAVQQQGRQLNESAQLLHKKGLFGMPLLELIDNYLELQDVEGHLPIPDTAPVPVNRESLDNRLACVEELCDTAEKLGTAPGKHPLRLVKGIRLDDGALEKLPEVAGRLDAAIAELEGAAERWLERTELKAPVNRSDWTRLQQAASLLLEWREIPKQWRGCTKIPRLADMMTELKTRTELVESLFDQIDEAWGEAVLGIDAAKLARQWTYYRADWNLPQKSEEESLLRRRLSEAESLLEELEQAGSRWAKAIEAPAPSSRESWERNYEIAAELARWKEIPREWGDCVSLDALLWDVGEMIDIGRHAKESKQVLLRDWSEDFLKLNGGELLEEWNKEGGTWGLGWLKRQSELREKLAPLCRLKLNSDVIEGGIRWLADYQQELGKCDEIYHRWERELREVYRGEDTVWVWLETAKRVAGESRNWLQELTGSGDFLKRFGSSEAAVSAAIALQSQWEATRDVLGRLDVMLHRTVQGDSENWMEQRRADCRRLRNLMNIRSHLDELAKEPVPMHQIGEVLEALAIYQQAEAELDVLFVRWEPELTGLYEGLDTDWEGLLTMARKAVRSDDQITRLTGDLELRCRLADDETALNAAQTLVEAYGRVADTEGEIQTAFSAQLSSEDGDWLGQLRGNSDVLVQNRDRLPLWMEWNRLCSRGERLGLRAFCACFDQPEGRDLRRLFRKSIYRWALAQELGRMKAPFSSRKFNETLKQFIQTQRQFAQRTREELFHLGASYVSRALRDGENQEEIGILRQANRTGGADTTADELVSALPGLSGQCFPCVVASPWDALRCYGRQAEDGPVFDYIVLESAQQYPQWVGRSLLRLGRTALVLSRGDTTAEDFLSACQKAQWPELTLDTCYLPRQESLFWLDQRAFGTRSLPTARPDEFRLACKTVLGRLEQNTNPPEAEAVTDAVVQLARSGSIHVGVVAMTWPQKRLIRSLLDQSAAENPALGLGQVEVITPEEAVSGRYELTLLSLTLAEDRRGSLAAAQRLAALWDGWHTLSAVLATAKDGVWVFSSLDRQDVQRFAHASLPLTELLDYMDREQTQWQERSADNIIQKDLCEGLNRAGYAAEPGPEPISVQVALREQPQRPVLGILLDDGCYSAVVRAEEREITRTQLLQERGWQLCRVWAMDWWRSQREVLEGLCQLLEHLPQSRPQRHSQRPEPKAAPAVPEYEPASLPVIGIRPDELSSPAFRSRIIRVTEEILQQEAPISQRQLTDRLLELFEMDREDEELRQVCGLLWERLGLRMTREGELRFIWMTHQDPDRWRSFRKSGTGAHYRSPEDVSAQESANAACWVLEQQGSQTPLALARETARALGYDGTDDEAVECGRRGVEHALFMGRLMETAIGSLMNGVRK